MKIGSLFSGIGGLELGLEAAIPNSRTIWQVENEKYPRQVLARHWPNANRSVTDVRVAGAINLTPVDLICGGFPCQDISLAGTKRGFDGEKSSLWFEMARIIGELRPRFIILENVSNITSLDKGRVLGRILGDLAELRYDAEWHRISASEVGAPHLRRRFFLIGWTEVADPISIGAQIPTEGELTTEQMSRSPSEKGGIIWNPWSTIPEVDRVVDGNTRGLHLSNRLRCLGNAVVPQCSYVIGKRLMEIQEYLKEVKV